MLSTVVVKGRPNPLYWKFAERLRQTRRAAKLTASDLSLVAGMSRGAVGLMEAERGLPLLSTAERLADVLKVSAGWLAYGLATPWDPAPEPRYLGLAARLRMLRAEQGLSLAEVGRRAGSSAAAVRSVEATTLPTLATLENLAVALQVSPAWLAFGIGPRELPKRGSRSAAPEPWFR